MCGHNWYTVQDPSVKVKFCVNCGLTRLDNGRILFDKDLIRYIQRIRKKEAKANEK